MAHSGMSVCCFFTLLLTRCYSIFAILDKKVYIEDELRRNYRLEDFLWSGSGDGTDEGESGDHSWQTTTVYQTTTILTTIYPTPTLVKSTIVPVGCIGGEDCFIQPTPTLSAPSATAEGLWPPSEPPFQTVPEPKYWVITVLKVNTTLDLNPTQFEPRLARLYRIAFNRQQALHLGWNGSGYWNSSTALQFAKQVIRRRREKRDVSVRVHNLRTNPGSLELVYSVKVAGRPVLALAAARDMRLVSEGEATSELGYPIETKAEPYLRSSDAVAEAAARSRDTWLLIGSGLSAIILFIILISIFILGYNNHKRKQKSRQGNLNRSRVFDRESSRGITNIAFQEDQTDTKTGSRASLSHHSASDQSDFSEAALVRNSSRGVAMINPPTASPTPTPKPRSTRASSPNSYLSMPSVKAFPRRTKIPEPLNQVLAEDSKSPIKSLTRHGSVEGNDPGVVGPIVWDLHCHRLFKQECLELEDDPSLIEPNVGRMRRRFHQLLDDAFSLFGSPPPSPSQPSPSSSRSTSIDIRAKSALVRPVCDINSETILRPKTSVDPAVAAEKLDDEYGEGSRPNMAGVAWGTAAAPSPSTPLTRSQSRPLSAGPFHRPTIEPQFILADATLAPTDPAVPIISAIKQELERLPSRSSSHLSPRPAPP